MIIFVAEENTSIVSTTDKATTNVETGNNTFYYLDSIDMLKQKTYVFKNNRFNYIIMLMTVISLLIIV